MTTAQLIKDSIALDVDIMTLDAGLFQQIIAPTIETEQDYADRIRDAEDYCIGYAVAPQAGRATVWLIVLQDGRLWKWALILPEVFHVALTEHEWLTNVSQVFLTGDTGA